MILMEWLQVQFLLLLLTLYLQPCRWRPRVTKCTQALSSYKVSCNILCVSQSAPVTGGGHR